MPGDDIALRCTGRRPPAAGGCRGHDAPTHEDLAAIAGRYQLGLDAAGIESFRAIIGGAVTSYDEVERLYAERLPAVPDRPYAWPSAAENELGAW